MDTGNTWIGNALAGQRTTIGGLMLAIGGALMGAPQLGIHVPGWGLLIGLILTASGPVILGTQARQGNVSTAEVKAVTLPNPKYPA